MDLLYSTRPPAPDAGLPTAGTAATAPAPEAAAGVARNGWRPPLPDGSPGELVLRGISKAFAEPPGANRGERAGRGTALRRAAALEDVSLTCRPGEFVVVVGPSGCGKSTLLNVAAGMVKPDAGAVTLDGRPVNGPGPDRAMVFQDHGLFPWLTAAQNISFGLK